MKESTREATVMTEQERRDARNEAILDTLRQHKYHGRGYVTVALGRGTKVHGARTVTKGHSGYVHPRAFCQTSTSLEYAALTGNQETTEVTCKRCLASMTEKGLS